MSLRLWHNYFLWMKKLQFLNSLMDKRLYFSLKRCGFEFSSISFFSSFFLICLFVRLYSWFCVHMDIFIWIWHTFIQQIQTWIISISQNLITLYALDDFKTFVVICWLVLKIIFSKYLSGTLSKCQTVCIQIRTDVLSVLIWEQTVN